MLVIALVHSRLDYGNSVLTGIPAYLTRRLLNAAARLLYAAEVFWPHDWCIGLSPLAADTRAHRVQDRSVDLQSNEWYGTAISGTIKVRVAYLLADGLESSDSIPAVKLSTIGSRAFSVSSPQTWNQLPEEVTSATPLSTFQRHLKTFLFRKSFPDIIADWHFSGRCGTLITEATQKKILLVW